MRRAYLICICVCLSVSLTALAVVIDFRVPLKARSADGTYRFEVIPPHFKHDMSYEAFQAEQFMFLTLSEGENIAQSAAVVGKLYNIDGDNERLIWARPLSSTVIPTRAFVFSDGTNVVAVTDGQRRYEQAHTNYFALYQLNGFCLTNGFYRSSRVNRWQCNQGAIELLDEREELKWRLRFQDSK